MAARQLVKRKVAMEWLRADDARGQPSVHRIKYRRKDGTVGIKKRVSKSFRHLPGAGKFRGNVNLSHTFLFKNHDETDPARQHFQVLIDLLIEIDGFTIDHTNGEYGFAAIR